MKWLERQFILNKSEWEEFLFNKRIVRSSYIAIFIGFALLFVNDGRYLFDGKFSILFFYSLSTLLSLIILTLGVRFRIFKILPISVIIFNFSFILTNVINCFIFKAPITEITVCYTVLYFIVNAIFFRLTVVLFLNCAVLFAVLMCVAKSFMVSGSAGSVGQSFMPNALVLSIACLLLQHLVLTVRGLLIEQVSSIKLKMATLEAKLQIENANRVAREKAVQLNRISAVEALGASIAHEINQPIAAALTYSQAARNWAAIECEAASETLRAVAGVESNVERAAKIIENIRLLTTNKDRTYALIDVRDIVKDQVSLARGEFDKRGIDLSLEPANSDTRAFVCAPEIALATINLLRNAMEAFDDAVEDGVVSVECRRTDRGWIEILVIDNGKGLADEDLQKAFGAFQSTKAAGAGIGLSICQEVAEHHSGSISLTRNQGRGMTATLRLSGKQHSA